MSVYISVGIIGVGAFLYATMNAFKDRNELLAKMSTLPKKEDEERKILTIRDLGISHDDEPRVLYLVLIGDLTYTFGKPYFATFDRKKAVEAIESYVKVYKGNEYRFTYEEEWGCYFMEDGELPEKDRKDMRVEAHIVDMPLDTWMKESVRGYGWESFVDLN
jgi:hypothetical protein